ncbi:MAG TPA: hypothetical protein VMQ44_01130 [Candidatus Saccharimonadales bacterium]|nr:hypothetical protein [Candidatus Saccharimonadales bacterium]
MKKAKKEREVVPAYYRNDPDFPRCFREVMMSIIVSGFYKIKQDDDEVIRRRVTSGEIPDLFSQGLKIGLPCYRNCQLNGLHSVIDRMKKEGCFPEWFRTRIHVRQDWYGPDCEMLTLALVNTAHQHEEGSVSIAVPVAASWFTLILDPSQARKYLARYEITTEDAANWGERFYLLWEEERRKIREFEQEKAERELASRGRITPQSC